jgi:5-(carboxyamino)imidazole ribonucleotide synthase
MAARTMGYRTMVLEPDPAAPAGPIADVHLVAPYDDEAALAQLGDECAVVTVEFENPPAAALAALERRTFVAPDSRAVAVAQDRIAEKQFLVDAGLPVGPYAIVGGTSPDPAVRYPAILKTARLGYDGKGQRRVDDAAEMRAAWTLLGGVPCVIEAALELDAEVSAIVARTRAGDVAVFPVTSNVHVAGVLDVSTAPARVSRRVADRAAGLAMTIADALDYVGVLAVEFFLVDGELFVNELAPRPHNSGHWTLDVAQTSQFEQQIRAVCGLRLGDTSMTQPGAAMVNLLGDRWDLGEPRWDRALEAGRTALHLYGKAAPRPGRKMGHLTAWGASASEAEVRARAAREAITP